MTWHAFTARPYNSGGCWKEGAFSACFDNIDAKRGLGRLGLDPGSVPATKCVCPAGFEGDGLHCKVGAWFRTTTRTKIGACLPVTFTVNDHLDTRTRSVHLTTVGSLCSMTIQMRGLGSSA
jgi:hypothetical protein